MKKTKTIVNIAGKQYTIVGDESAEYIHRVALKVNSKYNEMKMNHSDLNNIQLSMLTAINIADEYTKMKDELEVTKKEVEMLRSKLEKHLKEASSGSNTVQFKGK